MFPYFCKKKKYSRHRSQYIFIKRLHNVCSIFCKTQEVINYVYDLRYIGKYWWMPGIGKCHDLPIYRYYVNCLCCVLYFISQWKQSIKKDTSRYKHRWIYDIPTNVQYIFIEAHQTWFSLTYNRNSTIIFIAIYNHNITMLLIAIRYPLISFHTCNGCTLHVTKNCGQHQWVSSLFSISL